MNTNRDWNNVFEWFKKFSKLITRPIRDERSPHCGAKQRKKYSTPGRYNFMPCTFKNQA